MTEPTKPAAPIDLSRERFEILQSIGSADYLHMALLDEVDLWRERCANFEGKQELVDHLNDVLAERDRLIAKARHLPELIAVLKIVRPMVEDYADYHESFGILNQLDAALALVQDQD